jgi:hypothetical protein
MKLFQFLGFQPVSRLPKCGGSLEALATLPEGFHGLAGVGY